MADSGGAEMQAERNDDALQRRLALYELMAGFTRASLLSGTANREG